MSTFIRRYSRYLNEKAFAYRQMSFDFVRVKKGYVCFHFSPHYTRASSLVSRNIFLVYTHFMFHVFMSYLTSIVIRIEHITHSFSCVGWTQLPPAQHWVRYMASLRALSGGMNTEWVNTHTHSGRVCVAGRQKVPLVGTEKYNCSV